MAPFASEEKQGPFPFDSEAIMAMIQSNGKQISYATGRGGIQEGRRTLVFVHGAGGSRLHWNYQRQFFEKVCNVAVVDLPGHGEAGGEGEDSVGAYARHLLNLVQALPGDVFCLLGHSLGGAIVQEFTLLHPEYVEALVLVGTGARLRVLREILEGIRERFEETVRLICDYAFSKKTSPDVIQKGIETMLKTSKTVLYGDFLACDRFDIMDRVETIWVPTLVVCGTDDLMTPPKYAQFLVEKIPGARLEIIDGSGHMVMMEKPDEFNGSAIEFLENVCNG